MAIMDYVTPGIMKIDFEDSLFVLTDVGRDNTKDVQTLIESRGGIVKSSVTRSTNYLIYGDGEEETTKYKKALELINEKGLEINVLPFSLFSSVVRGEGLIEFGSYPFEENRVIRPLKWKVLKRKGNRALLLSANGLDAKRYNEEWEHITWEDCTLRKWLNEEFINTAFSAEEQLQIITTKVKNPNNPEYKTPGGNDTEDKVFLLSISEVKQYLPAAFERRVEPTPYAVKNGAYKGYDGNCWWWLRSPGSSPNSAAYVDNDGGIDDGGLRVFHGVSIAVCPALWVDLKSDIE